ncbi:MAG: hypothetical protein H7Y33_07405 [Cytophagales bacterium]|nr:hypothetical protein [Rhizobacter sp.]
MSRCPMPRQPWTSRLALWAAVCALLLKAAVPMLASASAQAQGKTLVEVCTVYGVATVALDEQSPQPAPEHAQAHSGEHCVLTALVAFAAPEARPLALPVVQAGAAPPQAHPSPQAPDACATWVARLKHGPPAFA